MKTLQLGQGMKLSWQEYGNSQGYPVFYFHGLPGSRIEPETADAAARDLGVRIISVDRFGYGGSILANGCGVFEFSDALSEIASALKLCRYSLLGFSSGALYALAYASKLGERIDQVAIVSSPADFSTPAMQDHFNPEFKPLYELAAANPHLARQQLEPMAQSTEAVMQLIQTDIAFDDQRIFSLPAFYASYSKNITNALNQGIEGVLDNMHQLASTWPFDIREIRVPTTIWHGEQDRNCGVAIANYLTENIPFARLHILPGKGHYFIFEHWYEILSNLVNEPADAKP